MPDGEAGAAELLLGGRMRLRQFRSGHRAGTDAVLLAAAAPRVEGLIVDVGAGSGAVGIAAALRSPRAHLELLEIDAANCALAQENLEANGLAARARAIVLDVLTPRARRESGVADGRAELALTNPPFHEPGRVRSSPDPARSRAHVFAGADEDPLASWMRAVVALTAPGGHVVTLYRADRLDALLRACAGRLGALSVLPIHPRADAPAIRVVVAGRKGSRAPMRLRPGLVLHREDGAFTDLAEALHRGEAVLGEA